jgi:outer membrane cobalamin receptor
MRTLSISLRLTALVLLCLSPAFSEIKVKVIDPSGAAVAGAQVQFIQSGSSLQAVRITSSDGTASFQPKIASGYTIQVLAPGFAPQALAITAFADVTVHLQIATSPETVVVTATRTPLESASSGASAEALSSDQLSQMQPVGANDAIRFLPGAVVNTAGQRGGLSSLFVQGGDSTYNKVIVDGVTINEPGGYFDFSTLRLIQTDRLEFVRGAQSALYGTDAMTSVIQTWSRTGATRRPQLTFGADGGNFGTAHGYAALSGIYSLLDYNFFGDQFNTNGQGTNNSFSDSFEGANVGVALGQKASLRVRVRHSNSHTGVPGEWSFNGDRLEQPDPNEWAQLNTLLGSAQLTITGPSRLQHRLTGFDYSYQYNDVNLSGDPDRLDDYPAHEVDHINRVGFEYQGDFLERTWAHSTFGYRLENENGFIGDILFPPQTHGQRLNQDLFCEQTIVLGRFTAVGGARFAHNSAYGNVGVPQVALTFVALRGGQRFSGTRLKFSYATGFKEPRLEETFAGPPYTVPNPNLQPERNRAFETGFQQGLFSNRFTFTATYFNNLFHNRIDYSINPATFIGQYVNVDKSFAQGAEVELQGQIRQRIWLNAAYTYTSTEILQAPVCTPANFCSPLLTAGQPLLRRPKNSATALVNYLGKRWAGNLGASFVGPRPDSDFLGYNINHAAGYVRVDVGGSYQFRPRIAAYANVENALNQHYNEVVGYPALGTNFRAGLRFLLGAE